jgi:pimeloyl-ACP methyl ester carboxylesterase
VVRVIRSTAPNSLNARLALAGSPGLDGSSIHYVGQSLGTFNGTVFAASNPAVTNVALNVPGASQVDVLLTAPAFAAQRSAFLGSLAALGLVPGTPGFDQFMVLARTILDPADPRNLVYDAVHSPNTSRKVFLQYIEGDQVLPNATTQLLIDAANQNPARQARVFEFREHSGTPAAGFIPASYPLAARHGFLLDPAGNPECNPLTATCATVVGQSQIVTFLATGMAP